MKNQRLSFKKAIPGLVKQNRIAAARSSPAKINLTLEILGQRNDGYHDICTVFQTIALSDELQFEWDSSKTEVICEDPEVPQDDSNLILKALHAVEEVLSFPLRLRVFLKKEIPLGGGLGGGSSNAAAILLEAGRKFNVPPEKIYDMACRLGGDVPFFLTGGTALGNGKGEIIEELPSFPSFSVVVVKPPFSVSTSMAYSRVTSYSTGEKTKKLATELKNGNTKNIFAHLTNDFEAVVFPLHPQLAEIKKIFLENGALGAQLSGSGSSVFAIASDVAHAKSLAASVEKLGKVWITQTTS